MIFLNGKFDGKTFVVDHLPPDIPVNTPVRIVLNPKTEPTDGLDAITGIAGALDSHSSDFAAQHEHYYRRKATPKR